MKSLASALLILVLVPVGLAFGQESSPHRRALECPASGLEKSVAAQNPDPQEILRGFKSYDIQSDTLYLHRETLLKELQKRGEFFAWELTSTEDSMAADVVITITLPLLTWEWNYRMVYQPTGLVLGVGEVSAAVEKTAAPQLAAMIVKRIREARPLPASFRETGETQRALETSSPEKGKSWRVRYVWGPASNLPKDRPVTVTLNHESMTVRDSKAILFSAPVQNLSASDSRTEVHRAAKGWEDFWGTSFDTLLQDDGNNSVASAAAKGTGAAVILMATFPIALVGEGVLAPIKTTDHFVTMYWLEAGVVKNAEFRASASDTKSLLTELNRVTGRAAEDLQQLSQKQLKSIAKQFDASPIIETDRQVNVGWRSLAPGAYRLVVVPREKNRAEIYFFAGNFQGGSFNANDVAAHAVVELERRKTSAENKATPSVSYREQSGLATFSQIRTGELILRFTAIPLGFAK